MNFINKMSIFIKKFLLLIFAVAFLVSTSNAQETINIENDFSKAEDAEEKELSGD